MKGKKRGRKRGGMTALKISQRQSLSAQLGQLNTKTGGKGECVCVRGMCGGNGGSTKLSVVPHQAFKALRLNRLE